MPDPIDPTADRPDDPDWPAPGELADDDDTLEPPDHSGGGHAVPDLDR